MNKGVFSFSTGIAAFPLLCYVALAGAAGHTWLAGGHWPSYGNPDPHSLPIYHLGAIAALAGLVSVILCPAAVLAHMWLREMLKKAWTVHVPTALAAYTVGSLFWVFDFVRWRAGTGGLVNWIFD